MKRRTGLACNTVKKYLRRIENESEVPDFQYFEQQFEASVERGTASLREP